MTLDVILADISTYALLYRRQIAEDGDWMMQNEG